MACRAGAPLVCTGGQPSVAVMHLLERLAAAGASLRYHGDFDWPCIGIANRVLRRTAARPWRYSAADYLAAARPSGKGLKGDPVEALWEPGLRLAMQRAGVQVEEEQVLDDLGDLAATSRRSGILAPGT